MLQRRTDRVWHEYLNASLDDRLNLNRDVTPDEAVLALFTQVSATVPAYRVFLAEHGVDPGSVRTPEDFRRLPAVTKDNYVRRYPLAERCRDGSLLSCDMMAVSSGSTGEPTFWPRALGDELAIAARFEQVFHDSFHADGRRTLAVVCFALGTWVGGMFTASCCRHLAARGYPVFTVTPGSNPDEILRVVQGLAPEFDQTVLLGYPPFLKDAIDAGRAKGVDWASFHVKMVLAGEVFSEEWRDLVAERMGSSTPELDFASIYGTADAGVLANETPLSIAARRFLARNPEAAHELFGEARLPTLAQYDPYSRYFEVEDGRLLFTGDNGVPLIRYNILDSGGVIPFTCMLDFLSARGFDARAAAQAAGARALREMPFVYVFGRSHFAVSFYGANVYPENVMVGLQQPEVRDWVTGKFVMETVEDEARDPNLRVIVELAHGTEATDARRDAIASSIRAHLERLNSEFAHYAPTERRTPQVVLAPHADAHHFPAGVKHRYTR